MSTKAGHQLCSCCNSCSHHTESCFAIMAVPHRCCCQLPVLCANVDMAPCSQLILFETQAHMLCVPVNQVHFQKCHEKQGFFSCQTFPASTLLAQEGIFCCGKEPHAQEQHGPITQRILGQSKVSSRLPISMPTAYTIRTQFLVAVGHHRRLCPEELRRRCRAAQHA